jgi:hypothetical protein
LAWFCFSKTTLAQRSFVVFLLKQLFLLKQKQQATKFVNNPLVVGATV